MKNLRFSVYDRLCLFVGWNLVKASGLSSKENHQTTSKVVQQLTPQTGMYLIKVEGGISRKCCKNHKDKVSLEKVRPAQFYRATNTNLVCIGWARALVCLHDIKLVPPNYKQGEVGRASYH